MEESRQALINRAQEAHRLLNSPVFDEAVAATRALFVREWRSADTVAKREMCWAKEVGLDEVARQLKRMVSQGEVAAHYEADDE